MNCAVTGPADGKAARSSAISQRRIPSKGRGLCKTCSLFVRRCCVVTLIAALMGSRGVGLGYSTSNPVNCEDDRTVNHVCFLLASEPLPQP